MTDLKWVKKKPRLNQIMVKLNENMSEVIVGPISPFSSALFWHILSSSWWSLFKYLPMSAGMKPVMAIFLRPLWLKRCYTGITEEGKCFKCNLSISNLDVVQTKLKVKIKVPHGGVQRRASILKSTDTHNSPLLGSCYTAINSVHYISLSMLLASAGKVALLREITWRS